MASVRLVGELSYIFLVTPRPQPYVKCFNCGKVVFNPPKKEIMTMQCDGASPISLFMCDSCADAIQ